VPEAAAFTDAQGFPPDENVDGQTPFWQGSGKACCGSEQFWREGPAELSDRIGDFALPIAGLDTTAT